MVKMVYVIAREKIRWRRDTKDGLAAGILRTVNKHLSVLIVKINFIMNLAEHPQMYGLQNSMCARKLYESEVVTPRLNNSAS